MLFRGATQGCERLPTLSGAFDPMVRFAQNLEIFQRVVVARTDVVDLVADLSADRSAFMVSVLTPSAVAGEDLASAVRPISG